MPEPVAIPRLLLIADGFSRPGVSKVVLELVRCSVLPWVQLRDHSLEPERYRIVARALVAQIRALSGTTLISLNSDVALALELGTGLHVGRRGPSPEAVRRLLGGTALVGYSAHEPGELVGGVLDQVSFVTASPVFDSVSKHGLTGRGLGFLRSMVAASYRPVLALGGVTPDRVAGCLAAGAYGVAVVGGIILAADPVSKAKEYLVEL